jgi:hypothetical protein
MSPFWDGFVMGGFVAFMAMLLVFILIAVLATRSMKRKKH